MKPSSRITIRDVAATAGVSVATVSKVLNARYGVSAATSAHVQAVIRDLGYEASLVAQSLRNHKTNVIGILVADLEPFSTELLKGAAKAIKGTGYELVVYSAGGRTSDQAGWEQRYLSRLSGTLIDGAVLVTPTVVDIGHDVGQGTAVVAVDPHAGPSGLPTVDSDNLNGARLGTQHLLDLGHRRIAMITGRPDLESSRLREQGFRDAMRDAGVPVDPELIEIGDYDPDSSAAAARLLLGRPDRPTAVFGANDVSAIAAVEVAASMGLRVPDDLSVVGFDNVPEAALASPALTTVEQPIHAMGHRAIELLIRLIHGEDVDATHVRLPTRLVVRHSTRAL
ncbi:LacI family DNA-binding transcriptional regulator [Dactylosporangium sp. NPDC005555]|uniref:LacI family DNA-binding transcriptional regulator n=1 Tax=Dactylosporangium sp. NPDC005555 TaxID=3154889 RepID=UPI0033BB76BB